MSLVQFGFGGSGSSGPEKLPLPERNPRWEWLKRETGVRLTEQMEPSHELCDLAIEMTVTNVLSYIPWEKLTKRMDEIRGALILSGCARERARRWLVGPPVSRCSPPLRSRGDSAPRRLKEGDVY